MLVKEYYSGATKIRIMDDYMAKTPEENQRVKENIDNIIWRINERVNREEAERLQKEREKTQKKAEG